MHWSLVECVCRVQDGQVDALSRFICCCHRRDRRISAATRRALEYWRWRWVHSCADRERVAPRDLLSSLTKTATHDGTSEPCFASNIHREGSHTKRPFLIFPVSAPAAVSFSWNETQFFISACTGMISTYCAVRLGSPSRPMAGKRHTLVFGARCPLALRCETTVATLSMFSACTSLACPPELGHCGHQTSLPEPGTLR